MRKIEMSKNYKIINELLNPEKQLKREKREKLGFRNLI